MILLLKPYVMLIDKYDICVYIIIDLLNMVFSFKPTRCKTNTYLPMDGNYEITVI